MIDWDDKIEEHWYKEYQQTDRWKRLSCQCKERDGYTCQFCRRNKSALDKIGIVLDAHHTTYEYLGNENEQLELDSLITLCRECHDRYHKAMDHPESLNEHYKKIRMALMLPAIPALIKSREAEIQQGAQLAHEILKGCPRGYGIPNKVYRLVADRIEGRRNQSINIQDLYLIRHFAPSLYEGIQKNENIMYKREQRGDT